MVYSEEELQRIAEVQEGNLEEIPFAVLLYALARSERSVVLEIARKPLTKEIVFEQGRPVECRSNLVTETLSRFMVSTGRIDEATGTACFNESVSRGVRFGDVLIEKGIISAEELLKVLQQNLARKLLDGFSWREGTFCMGGQPESVDSSLKVNVAQLIVIGVTRFATQDQVDGSIGDLIGKPLTLHPNPFFSSDEIKLSAAQLPLVEALRARNLRVDELAGETGIPYHDLTRLLYVLTLIGVVIRADQVSAGEAPAATAAETLPAAPPGTEPPTDEMREELMRLVLNHRRMDAFELLGLDENVSLPRIEARFLEYAEKFAPWRYGHDLADRARNVFMAGVRAYTQLIDPDRRRAIAEKRTSVAMPKARGGSGDQFRIETKLLDPAVQFRKGKALMEKGDYGGAVVQLEYAADLDSQNAAYRAELAYCRFLDSPETQDRRGLVDLQQALRIDSRCGLAMFYAGQILRHQGRLAEAAEVMQKAIKPMTPDRRPIDALREIKTEQKAR